MVTCQGVLPNYANVIVDPAGGITSQKFEPALESYDSQAADDFIAPGSGESTICEVSISGSFSNGGFTSDPNSQILFMLYEDAGGIPGALMYSESFPAPADASFVLEPTGGPNLVGGNTYWLCVQAVLDFSLAGQWFWDTAMDGNGEIYAWQNPQGGFGMGCPTWSPHNVCGLAGEADLLMDISFNEALSVNSNTLAGAVDVFPNPAKNEFTLRSSLPLDKLTIFDIRGRVVRSHVLSDLVGDKTIDITNLETGMYLVQIFGEKGTLVKNLLKQ